MSGPIRLIAGRELGEALRNRWFALFAVLFALVALGLSWLAATGAGGQGFAGLGRTAASLINLVMLVVPLAGLVLAAGSIAGERDRGTLAFLLAQPVSPWQVVVGKFAGLLAASGAALFLGFGIAALVIAGRGGAGPAGSLAGFLVLAALLAAASVACGLALSALAPRAATAVGLALALWLGLVFLGDLGLMGTSLALGLGARELVLAAFANPVEVFRITTLAWMRGDLEVLGPAGQYASRLFGDRLLAAGVALLALWTAVPLALAAWALERRRALP